MSGKPPPQGEPSGPVTRQTAKGRAQRQKQPAAAKHKRRMQIAKAIGEQPESTAQIEELPPSPSPAVFLEDDEFPATNYTTPQPEDGADEQRGAEEPTADPSATVRDDAYMDEMAPSPLTPAPTQGLDDYELSDTPEQSLEPPEPSTPTAAAVNVETHAPATSALAGALGGTSTFLTRQQGIARVRQATRKRANSSPTPPGPRPAAPIGDTHGGEARVGSVMALASIGNPNLPPRESAVRTTIEDAPQAATANDGVEEGAATAGEPMFPTLTRPPQGEGNSVTHHAQAQTTPTAEIQYPNLYPNYSDLQNYCHVSHFLNGKAVSPPFLTQ
ncbi:hypothetical protein C8Q70DRAFT_1058584 [Cubamyces menziesii]|uniref:Uncharacterized protein n=1 Tax=Trametes cubensis TaxID=1111947 RepID=A0AAD7U4L3_9APHY|nr:hypothetical protein C8Q70DRAFT_1058584 [Cubamyces menziesii]KAJ8502216.1 hypothetical protein ONZ51_g6 [Trametes cubensis]